jgi:two-component system OmpR family response regulator
MNALSAGMVHPRVLVVEDEGMIRTLMVEVLQDAGFTVDHAADSDEAVKMLDADGYQLLVTDIHMPGRLDGIELGERAHGREPGLPIVFVTARPDVLARIKDAGIPGASLTKPFTLEKLVSVVRGLLCKSGDARI